MKPTTFLITNCNFENIYLLKSEWHTVLSLFTVLGNVALLSTSVAEKVYKDKLFG